MLDLNRFILKIIQKYKKKTHIQISQNKQKSATEIIVYTKDKLGLLYRLSGAVSISGFNVIEAKVSTLNNGMALDVLWVRDLNGSMLDSLYHFSKLEFNMPRNFFAHTSQLKVSCTNFFPCLPILSAKFLSFRILESSSNHP